MFIDIKDVMRKFNQLKIGTKLSAESLMRQTLELAALERQLFITLKQSSLPMANFASSVEFFPTTTENEFIEKTFGTNRPTTLKINFGPGKDLVFYFAFFFDSLELVTQSTESFAKDYQVQLSNFLCTFYDLWLEMECEIENE